MVEIILGFFDLGLLFDLQNFYQTWETCSHRFLDFFLSYLLFPLFPRLQMSGTLDILLFTASPVPESLCVSHQYMVSLQADCFLLCLLDQQFFLLPL